MKQIFRYAVCGSVVWFGACLAIGDELSSNMNPIHVEGIDEGVRWKDLVQACRPKLDISKVWLGANDWVIPWSVLQAAASDKETIHREAFRVVLDPGGRPVAIELDAATMAERSVQWKQEFAEWRASNGTKPAYRIEPVETSIVVPELHKKRLLVIAGYQSEADEAVIVAKHLNRCTGRPCEVFSYPTDGSLDRSGAMLAELLTARRLQSPDSERTIVGHSMGAVIARAAIELHQAPSVKKLIQIFPPNHGSVLAEIAEPLDGLMIAKRQLTKIFASLSENSVEAVGQAVTPAAALTWMSDGFGLASRDLCPASDFLRALNKQSRRESVDYAVLIGTGGPIHPLAGAAIMLSGPTIEQQLAGQAEVQEIRIAWKWIERLVGDGQLIQGQGDGVVSVASAKLSGVSDIATIDCNHVAWSAIDSESGNRVMAEVLQRIQERW